MKKVLSLFTVFTMVIAMSVCAFAANVTIEPQGNEEDFVAYQIFKGDVNDAKELTNAEWGDGLTKAGQDALVDEFNTKFAKSLDKEATTIVADMMEAMSVTDFDGNAFADILGKVVNTAANVDTSVDFTNNTADLADGYHFVKNTAGTLYSEYILKVVGEDFTVKSKTDYPTVIKKVQENSDDSWGDVADYNIGDAVPFRFVGKVPDMSDFNDYDGGNNNEFDYFYQFTDTAENMTIDMSTVTVSYYSGSDTSEEVATGADIKTNNAATDCKVTKGTSGELIVTFDNLDDVANIDTYAYIVVEYTATLDDTAFVATANPNTVVLDYSNNPNDESSKHNDEDEVNVYTFDFNIQKYYLVGEVKTDLAGAEFELSDANGDVIYFVGSNGVYTKADASATGATTTLVSDDNGAYSLKGLDDGIYNLKETKAPTVPTDFNLLTEEIEIKVEATYDDSRTTLVGYGAAKTDATVTNGTNKIEVENKAGLVLPETGGVGTTLFYVIGGLMMACATVVLVSRKRMAK